MFISKAVGISLTSDHSTDLILSHLNRLDKAFAADDSMTARKGLHRRLCIAAHHALTKESNEKQMTSFQKKNKTKDFIILYTLKL